MLWLFVKTKRLLKLIRNAMILTNCPLIACTHTHTHTEQESSNHATTGMVEFFGCWNKYFTGSVTVTQSKSCSEKKLQCNYESVKIPTLPLPVLFFKFLISFPLEFGQQLLKKVLHCISFLHCCAFIGEVEVGCVPCMQYQLKLNFSFSFRTNFLA